MLCERSDCHTRLRRVDPVQTARGIAVALERHERVRGDLELRGQRARRKLGSQREHTLQEARLAGRRPVQPAVGHGPSFERRERGRRQAGREVDREAVVLDPAEPPAEEEYDGVGR